MSGGGKSHLMRDIRARDLPPRARIAAIDSILDRALGKPMQPMQQQHLGADGQPVLPVFNVIRHYQLCPLLKVDGRAIALP
jgi:hypothetical protein